MLAETMDVANGEAGLTDERMMARGGWVMRSAKAGSASGRRLALSGAAKLADTKSGGR
jgi:hypothetical protein